MSKKHPAHDKALLIAKFASEKKGEDIVLMDMRSISNVCDWFVIVSASSVRRITAIAKEVQKGLSKENKKWSPLSVEGRSSNPYWVLLDYGDVIIHIFYEDIRNFYGLERLWSDAPKEYYDEKCLEKPSKKK